MSTDSTDHPGASNTGGSGDSGGSTLTKVLIFIIQPLVVVGGLLCFAGAVNGIFDVLEQLPEPSGDTAGAVGTIQAVDAAWIRDELEIVLVYLIGMALLWGVSLAIQIYSRYLRLSVGSTHHRGDDEPTRNNEDTAGN